MSRKNKNSVATTESATATQEAPPVDQVAQTEPTTEPIEMAAPAQEAVSTPPATPVLSAAEQIKALKAQLKALQDKASKEDEAGRAEREAKVNAAKVELDALLPAYNAAWETFKPLYARKQELDAIITPAKAKGQRSGNGAGKAPGNHKGDPTQGKGLTAYAFRYLRDHSGQAFTVKELYQGAKAEGWTPKEGAKSDDDASMAQLSSSLVQELKRPTPFVTRPEKGKYQVA